LNDAVVVHMVCTWLITPRFATREPLDRYRSGVPAVHVTYRNGGMAAAR